MTTNPSQVTTSQAPTWAALSTEDVDDLDEPPEAQTSLSRTQKNDFQRSAVPQPNRKSSLLTRAIMAQSDEEMIEEPTQTFVPARRRSITSNISIASTADLTSDTGFTSPARTNTPSPPIPELNLGRLSTESKINGKVSILGAVLDAPRTNAPSQTSHPTIQEPAKDAPRKRCIQFACGKPNVQAQPPIRSPGMVKNPPAQDTLRPSIKFACPARPASIQNTPPRQHVRASSRSRSPGMLKPTSSPSTPKKQSILSVALAAAAQQQTPVRLPGKESMARPKYLRANSKDLVKDSSQFHEFASGVAREHDWIRLDTSTNNRKLTIDDTMAKENAIRKLAKEAEEEAEMEEEEEEAALDDEDEELDEDDEEYEDEEEEEEEMDGYYTDEESGFASSDEEEEEDENMILWTPSARAPHAPDVSTPTLRRPSVAEQFSDSSANVSVTGSVRRSKAKRVPPQTDNYDLPDSTDFVCGTLDEDRPLEEAYLTSLAARRNEKLRVIPQDIDPSFPTSEPEDEDDEDIYNPVHHSSDEDEDDWVTGKMDDLHDTARSRRRRKSEQPSPRKYRSPPPKQRRASPAPKGRCRSPPPRRLFDGHSPRKLQVPQLKVTMITPRGSPRHGGHVGFQLAGRPGLTDTKSLPRPAALFPHMRHKAHKTVHHDETHVRSAIDIVKGLEKKRQRRKEKFHQKYCDRARRGQIPERKQKPGLGAERMKELGLLMAGKKDQGNYVLSV